MRKDGKADLEQLRVKLVAVRNALAADCGCAGEAAHKTGFVGRI